MGKGGGAPKPPDPQETAAAEAQYNRLDTYAPSGSGVRYGYTDPTTGSFVQGMAPEGAQSAAKSVESPSERAIRQTLEPAAVGLVDRMATENVEGMPDPARVRGRGDIAETIYNRNFSLMAPQIEQSNERLMTNLQARGLPVGGEAFNDAYGEQVRQTQDTLARMAMDADVAAGQEQSRLFGLESAQRDNSLREIATLMGGQYAPPTGTPSGQAANVGIGQAINNQYQAEMQQYQQNQQQKAGIASGIGQIGAAAIMKSAAQAKHLHGPLDTDGAAAALALMPMHVWQYRSGAVPGDEGQMHVGPTAEDWRDFTGLGDGESIAFIDYLGVLAGALQSALQRIEILERAASGERVQ